MQMMADATSGTVTLSTKDYHVTQTTIGDFYVDWGVVSKVRESWSVPMTLGEVVERPKEAPLCRRMMHPRSGRYG